MLNKLVSVFKSFHCHDVRYVVIGGIAAVLHGVPRATFNLDILIEATPDNAGRLLIAMSEAGLGTALLTTPDEVLAHVITVFKDRVRIDVQTSTPGITFERAWGRKVRLTFQGQDFWVIAKEDLLAAKKASGRQVDLEDVRILEMLPGAS